MWLPAGLKERSIRTLRQAEAIWGHWIQLGVRQDVRKKHRAVARIMRSLILGLFSFEFNQIPVRSAALTYTAILGVVPFIIILSAVAGQFGYIGLLQRFVPYLFDSMNLDFPLDPILGILKQAEKMNFQAFGLIGSLGLLLSFFLSMSNVELAIDHIWNLRKPRSMWGTVKAYTPFILLLAILMGVLGSVVVRFKHLVERVDFDGVLPALGHGVGLLIGAVLFIVFTWIGLVMLLLIVPNTRVKFLAAIVGGSVSTLLLFGLTRLFFFFPHLLYSQNNVVLGSLAFVPAMLLFVYVTWLLILYGAAVAFIYQKLYREEVEEEDDEDKAFHAMEAQVLAVLAAIETHVGEVEIPLPSLDSDGEQRILRESQAVRAQTLTEALGRTLGEVEKSTMPLQDLGWLRRRTSPDGPVYVLKTNPAEMDLLALHGLLVRLNPSGTGFLRGLNMLEEIKHTLGLLYSKSKDHPPFSFQTAKTLASGSQKKT
jgi:YihY family inner membrane protein